MNAPSPSPRLTWDIFCRVIDNYGDIGVCWRLARQLADEFGQSVRLWVDDLDSLAPLAPAANPRADQQLIGGIDLHRWPADFPTVEAAQVVIEAFACDLPDPYLAAMAARPSPPVWINLEYLSAENWVEGCHGLASPHPSLPLIKHFFFPGFTDKTGGLLFEAACRQPPVPLALTPPWEISLFCYDPAPVEALLTAWEACDTPIRCHVAAGKPQQLVSRLFGHPGPWRHGEIQLFPLPFLPQPEYDQLLRRCAINFVRGEDSWLRAQWAARPFVWQAYPQPEGAHLDKLRAFLDCYSTGMPTDIATTTRHLFTAWNSGLGLPEAWRRWIKDYDDHARYAQSWSKSLLRRASLAENLVKFAASKV